MKYYNDTDRLVWEYLQSIEVSFESVYHGEYQDYDSKIKRKYDSFTVRFWRGKSEIESSFQQGIGHRVNMGFNSKKFKAEAKQAGAGAPKILEEVHNKDMKLVRIYLKKPSAASVLYCLLSDASFGTELFVDFCSALGYDEDSRKALATYEECQKIAVQMRMFTSEERERLNELLEDY